MGYNYLFFGEKCIRKTFISVSLENCIFLAVRKAVTNDEMARHCRRQTRGVEETSVRIGVFQGEMLIDGWLHCEQLIVPLQEIYDIGFDKFKRLHG